MRRSEIWKRWIRDALFSLYFNVEVFIKLPKGVLQMLRVELATQRFSSRYSNRCFRTQQLLHISTCSPAFNLIRQKKRCHAHLTGNLKRIRLPLGLAPPAILLMHFHCTRTVIFQVKIHLA